MQTSDGKTLERKIQASADALHEAVSGLPEEATRKAASGRWSVLECIEHIALVQDGFSGRIVTAPVGAESAANPEREVELVRMVQSREQAISAPQVVAPRNVFRTLDDAMENFHQTNSRVLSRLTQVEPTLRSLQVQHPALGLLNGYEAFLVISAHTLRHVAQINEVVRMEGVTVAQ